MDDPLLRMPAYPIVPVPDDEPITGVMVAEAIRRRRYRYQDEDQLQEGIALALQQDFEGRARREVRLDRRSRVDLLVDRVVVEVKVASSASEVLRQVARYALDDGCDEIVVVTNRARHVRDLPAEVRGKPLHVVDLTVQGF